MHWKSCWLRLVCVECYWSICEGKVGTLCVLKPHREQSNLSLCFTHTQSHCLHTGSFSAQNRYNNTGCPLKTLTLLISSLNACVCVFTFTCMEIFFLDIIYLVFTLAFLPLGYDLWRKSQLCLPTVTKENNSQHQNICRSVFSLLLPFFPFVWLSWFFFTVNFFSEIHLISSPVSCIYDEAFMDFAYLTTRVYSCSCNRLISCEDELYQQAASPLKPQELRKCACLFV